MKKILILNGNPKEEKEDFDNYCEKLKDCLISKGDSVTMINLRNKKIQDCIGCYACWLKTPGICALKDDQEEILKGYVNSDLVILASPIIMGFVSAKIKTANDRMIPLVHPFLKLEGDRMSHYPRYDKDYKIGLLLEKNTDTDEDDMAIITKVYNRAVFIKAMDENVEVIANETHNI